MNDFVFDPANEEGDNFDLVPSGEYVAEIIDAAIKVPQSGDGHMLKLTFKIAEGEFEGRQIWWQLCYQHSKAQTQSIARRAIKGICDALDIHEQISDPEVFKLKPVRIRIGVKVNKSGQYDDRNKIIRVKPLRDGEAEEVKAPYAV
jgi:Protein of unknown function (DUF669)